MGLTFCRTTLVLVLLSSLHIIGPEVVSSEELRCKDMIPMMVAGAKVVRGKDWVWDDQDGSPPAVGTVLGPSTTSEGWFIVEWANNRTNNYRMGDGDKCDLKTVQQDKRPEVVSSEQLSCSDMIPMMVEGAKVVRGKDWMWGVQDGSPPTVGTVLGPVPSAEGWFRVQWENNMTYQYRMGSEEKCDLKIAQDKRPEVTSNEELSCRDMIPKMVAGARVVRAKDYPWKPLDNTPPTEGTVIGPYPLAEGWFIVEWDENWRHSYRMGVNGKCDLEIVQQNKQPTVPSSSTTTKTTSISSSVTTPQPESSTGSSPQSPTLHQCTCSKEISESQAWTEAETAELAKEAGRLAVETAKVVLEAAKATARAEEAERLLELEAKKVALEAARSIAKAEEAEGLLAVEVKKVALEAVKFIAMAEESWATNAAEDLIFERDRRNQTLQSYGNNKL